MTNLLAMAVNVHIGLLPGLLILGFLLGYMIRSSFIKACRKKIRDLESDMLRDNARILELEKEKAELLQNNRP